MSENKSEIIDFKKAQGSGEPLYEQIRKHIRRNIESMQLKSGDRLPNIASLTKQWHVNYRTIKAAFDLLHQDGLISWEPNKGGVVSGGMGDSRGTAKKLAIQFIRIQADGFYAKINDGISEFADKMDINYTVVNANRSVEKAISAITNAGEGTDGILVVPLEHPGFIESVKSAIEKNVKVVFIDRILDGLEVSSVCPDHFYGAYCATKKLLELHKRPVYHIGTADTPSSCREWVHGWSQAMAEFGHSNQDKYLFKLPASEVQQISNVIDYFNYNINEGMEFFDKIKEDKYSIFAGNDYVARGVAIAAEKRGLVLGNNVCLVGFGDEPFSSLFSPPIATVNENLKMVGYEAAEVLYESMSGRLLHPVSILIPTELMVRQSIGETALI